jgi:hypothetical protein
MRSGFSAADTQPSAGAALTTKEIPYDYVARFNLQGKPGNRVQDVINISVEGGFVAVAIGYSFIPAKPKKNEGGEESIAAALATFGPLVNWLAFAINPQMLAHCLAARLCGIEFKYSIVDSGSGRELQNQPIHNIAGLGESSGERPFRPFAKPMLFLPRSTIRIEVEEISEGPIYTGAELFIVLHGYKILGYGTALP